MNHAWICGAAVLSLLPGVIAAQQTVPPSSEPPESDPANYQAEDQVRSNDTPCGSDTVAVIRRGDRRTYAFCVNDEGVTVLEAGPDDGSRSVLDENTDPLEILRSVAPEDEDLPSDVVRSIEEKQNYRTSGPFRSGPSDISADAPVLEAHGNCLSPASNFTISQFFNDTTFCAWVGGPAARSNNDPDWHQRTASLLHSNGQGSSNHEGPHAPPTTYFADEDEEGDARYGRARVRSCGGTTRFRGWVKASPTTGDWNTIADWHVGPGQVFTMIWYANPFHSLWMGYDADDIRFRADSLGSSTTHGSYFYFLKYAYGPDCDMKF